MLLGIRVGEASNPGPNQFDDPEFDSGMFESLDNLAEPFYDPPPPEQDDEPLDGGPDAVFGEDVIIETRPFVKAEPQRGRLGKFSGSKPGMCFRLGEYGLGYYRHSPPCPVQPDHWIARRPTAVHVLELDELVPVPTPSVPAPPPSAPAPSALAPTISACTRRRGARNGARRAATTLDGP